MKPSDDEMIKFQVTNIFHTISIYQKNHRDAWGSFITDKRELLDPLTENEIKDFNIYFSEKDLPEKIRDALAKDLMPSLDKDKYRIIIVLKNGQDVLRIWYGDNSSKQFEIAPKK